MQLFIAAASLAIWNAGAFAPIYHHQQLSHSNTHLLSTAEPPECTAPDAGYKPEWEIRDGKAPDDFTKSDMAKDDLSGMWECPLTRWDSDG